jgi:Kef-type K+ transport system membrane component KefB
MAMAAAAFNDATAWILLALAVALAGGCDSGNHNSPLISIWVLSGAAFVASMLFAIGPAMKWVTRCCSSQHDVVDEAYTCLTLAGVLVSGFITDLIGVRAIFGAFIFGLTIPKGEFTDRLIEKHSLMLHLLVTSFTASQHASLIFIFTVTCFFWLQREAALCSKQLHKS